MEVDLTWVNKILSDFSIFDAIITFFILVFALKGLIGGFINEFSKLFGWIMGIWVAVRYGKPMGELINSIDGIDLGGDAAIAVAGFIIILSLFLISVYLINSILTAITKSLLGLNFINKILGFVFGGVKVFLIFSIIIGALHGIPLAKTFFFDRFKMDEEKLLFPLMVKSGKYILNLEYVKNTKEGSLENIKNLGNDEKSEKNEEI